MWTTAKLTDRGSFIHLGDRTENFKMLVAILTNETIDRHDMLKR
jgi:hypothetical protein